MFCGGSAGSARASSRTAPSEAKHVVVYDEPGRFGAWPANHGVWIWGNEIAVGFSRGWYKEHDKDHSIDRAKPSAPALARSLDGGVTWTIEDHPELEQGVAKSPPKLDFQAPNFALRVRDNTFYTSNDRGHHWDGPWAFPDFKVGQLTSRTDYLVQGPQDCLFFLSVTDKRVQAGIADRAFAVRTTDGGKTFKFLGWMTGDEPILARAAMPATVRAADGSLVSLLRRRFDLKTGYRNEFDWIDAYGSANDGIDWHFLSRVAYTDLGERNGNPPSLVRLPDGRLVAAYGVRYDPCGIRARVSRDNGRTWGAELVLRDDGRKWDLGYCRSVVRPDGRIVTIYYFTTAEHPEPHIEASIWLP